MVWKVEVKTSAAKEIARFDRTVQRRVYTFLKQLEGERNPREMLLPYTGALTGYWKKRIGDYRLIFSIEDRQVTVCLIKAGHRSKVYS